MTILKSLIQIFEKRTKPLENRDRVCAFEQMEPRFVLAGNAVASAAAIESFASLEGQIIVANRNNCGHVSNPLGLRDVSVQLLNATGLKIAESISNEKGNYEFENLISGIYAIQYIAPTGYTPLDAAPGSAGGMKLNPSLLGEIVVNDSSNHQDYTFCVLDSSDLKEQAENEITEIQPHGSDARRSTFILPNFYFFNDQALDSGVDEYINSQVTFPIVFFTDAKPLKINSQKEISSYGGSSKSLSEDANEIDELFSTLASQMAFDPLRVIEYGTSDTKTKASAFNFAEEENTRYSLEAIDRAIEYSLAPNRSNENVIKTDKEYYIASRPDTND